MAEIHYCARVKNITQVLIITLVAGAASAARADDGQDFTPQAQALYRIVACGGDAALPSTMDAKDVKIVDAHCKKIGEAIQKFHERWLDKATPFLAGIVPAGLPDKVVYPFGGGDLVTALTVYPTATEFTTISLEGSGDPRALDGLGGKKLARSLDIERKHIEALLTSSWNATINLNAGSNSGLPNDLSLTLIALAVHGYEPVSLRYLRLEKDGAIHYLTSDELAAGDKDEKARNQRGKKMQNEAQISIWDNSELTFRKRGDASGKVITFRHFAADLSDKPLPTDAPLLKHLAAKGQVAALTKAASYLLWYKTFSHVRDYLLANMVWMISDDTGIPVEYATKAGFEQDTYGTYAGAYFGKGDPQPISKDFIKLWKKSKKETPISFGYPDKKGQHIILITAKKK